jgi:chromosome segregation protein
VPRTKAACRASAWAAYASASNRRWTLHRQKDVALREARALEIQLGREAQEAGFSERECLSKLEDNAARCRHGDQPVAAHRRRNRAARTEVAGISDTVLQEQLHAALDAKQGKESALAERRNVLETAAAELRSLDEQRLKLEQGVPRCATRSTTCGSRRRPRR